MERELELNLMDLKLQSRDNLSKECLSLTLSFVSYECAFHDRFESMFLDPYYQKLKILHEDPAPEGTSALCSHDLNRHD